MAPFIFWNLAFYTIIRTQLRCVVKLLFLIVKEGSFFVLG
ncbi:putative phage DNA-binding protein [Paenibacillus larvae subsp. larvae DSM 25430]|nr:putative phage DNA-binding protein [Paenibacillus larvae subsp. larvae DSM 25430]